jgi:3-oxoacyl-[acyl-carrier protein] reductase
MGRLDNKVAVITGSGRGIGKAIAVLFAKEGAAVVINDIDENPARQTADEIQAFGGKAAICVADIRKPDDAQRLVDTAAEKFGKLDILVNNAGITRDNFLARMTDEQWDTCVDISLKGTFYCIRAASKHMMKKGHGGKIVNTSSIVGLMGNVGQANYSAAKAGIVGLTKTVAKEWARYDVNCNAVAYGFVDTRLTKERESGEEAMGAKLGIPKAARENLLSMSSGKIISPEEAAKSVLFLASDDANFITGNVLNVSAGAYM